MPDFVKFVNVGSRPFDFHSNNQKRIIEPGADAFVPWGLAVTLFGHPGTLNVHPRNERDKLYAKLRGKFNFQVGTLPPEAKEQGLSEEQWWEQIKPHIEVYDMETNERVYMVMDDPRGEHMSTAPDTTVSPDVETLSAQVALLTNQINQMLAQQGSQTPVPAPGTGEMVTPGTDAPAPGAVFQTQSPAPVDPELAEAFGLTIPTPDVPTSVDGPAGSNPVPPPPAPEPAAATDSPGTVPSGRGKLAPRPS